MKTSELREGNYIMCDSDFEGYNMADYQRGRPCEFGFYMAWLEGESIINIEEQFKPIPLTEQWLKDFGFEAYYSSGEYFGKMLLGYQKGELSVREVKYNEDLVYTAEINTEKNWVALTKTPYVHSLQNLYFALTGKELIK